MKECKQCNTGYEITEADLLVLKKFEVPEPQMCPDCRMQRRIAFRNEMNFHKTTCDLTGKSILTNIMPGRAYKVYDSEAWFSDKWDPLTYGRDYDFNRPFFEQYADLVKKVPHINLSNSNVENSEYCNHSVYAKDCYLTARIAHSEKIYYSYLPINSYQCFDCYFVRKTEEAYQVLDSSDCNQVTFSQRLKSCRNVHFSFDLIGCEDCFGCYGLRHKQYYFFNKKLSKEEYFATLEKLNLGSHSFVQKIRQRFYDEEVLKRGLRAAVIENSENAVGNYIYDSRNVHMGFDVDGSEDVRYGWGIHESKDNYDMYATYFAEEGYNTVAVFESQKIKCCYITYKGCYDLEYCMECFNNTKNCFGSVGLKHKEYCILNKQYSESEYKDLKAKIIEHMRGTGEYGEYFPMSLAPFAYNESVAGEYFPLTKKEIEAKGLNYFERGADEGVAPYDIPDDIKDVQDDILEAVLICEKTGRPYKVIPQELKFLRQYNIPIPRISPYQRHIERIGLRAPRTLWDRQCAKCQTDIKTSYSPDRPEIVYCEPCYLKEVY